MAGKNGHRTSHCNRRFRAFLANLKAISTDAVQGKTQSYQLAADFHNFGVDPSIKSSALNRAYEQLSGLKNLLGNNNPNDEAI